MDKQKIEQLEKTIEELIDKTDNLSVKDKVLREEFAKAFNWYNEKPHYGEATPKEPSWEEIFIKLGKLLAKIDVSQIESSIGLFKVLMEDRIKYNPKPTELPKPNKCETIAEMLKNIGNIESQIKDALRPTELPKPNQGEIVTKGG